MLVIEIELNILSAMFFFFAIILVVDMSVCRESHNSKYYTILHRLVKSIAVYLGESKKLQIYLILPVGLCIL